MKTREGEVLREVMERVGRWMRDHGPEAAHNEVQRIQDNADKLAEYGVEYCMEAAASKVCASLSRSLGFSAYSLMSKEGKERLGAYSRKRKEASDQHYKDVLADREAWVFVQRRNGLRCKEVAAQMDTTFQKVSEIDRTVKHRVEQFRGTDKERYIRAMERRAVEMLGALDRIRR